MRIDGGRVVTVAVVAHQEDEREEPIDGEEMLEGVTEDEAVTSEAQGEVAEEAVSEDNGSNE